MQAAEQIAKRLIEIEAQLDAVKALYSERDRLTMALVALRVERVMVDTRSVEVVDNFVEKNTVFRPAGVRRYEVKIK